ncbi:MAG: hypothetical protein H6573_34885 [Lewinellaceae bacterium]|nr:hypothetical protein [Lewinellaceae bacterium]
MPKIALVEPYDHSEVLYVLCELLLGQQAVKLCVFSQHYIKAHAPSSLSLSPEIDWFTFKPEGRIAFFQQHQTHLNNCHLILWITAVVPYGWMLELGLAPPVVLILHNRNNWFAQIKNLAIATNTSVAFFKDITRLLRWLLFQRRQQHLLLQKVAAVGYGSRGILEEANREMHLPASGKAFWIPFTYLKHRPAGEPSASETIKIVIPGTVTGNGRDYYSVARAFALALPHFHQPVNLVLLGKGAMAKGLPELQQLESERFRLTAFPHWVAQEEYAAQMRDADFLILPFRAWHKVGFVKEYWGRSGFSGAVSDMVYYGLPAISSTFHPLEPELEQWVERYAGYEELAALLVEWVNERKFLEAKKNIEAYVGDLQMKRASGLLIAQLMDLLKE